jgi:hypothetical protein
LLFFSQSRTAVSRTEDTDTLRRCASRSRSDLSSSDKRQLYISVFMHYIVVQVCTTLQYNSFVRILDPLDAGEIPPPPVLDAVGTYLELGQTKITVIYRLQTI